MKMFWKKGEQSSQNAVSTPEAICIAPNMYTGSSKKTSRMPSCLGSSCTTGEAEVVSSPVGTADKIKAVSGAKVPNSTSVEVFCATLIRLGWWFCNVKLPVTLHYCRVHCKLGYTNPSGPCCTYRLHLPHNMPVQTRLQLAGSTSIKKAQTVPVATSLRPLHAHNQRRLLHLLGACLPKTRLRLLWACTLSSR